MEPSSIDTLNSMRAEIARRPHVVRADVWNEHTVIAYQTDQGFVHGWSAGSPRELVAKIRSGALPWCKPDLVQDEAA